MIKPALPFIEQITQPFINAWNAASTWITTYGANVLAHLTRTDNPHQVTKAQVGLGDADNTSDANKPVSTAQQTALNLKLNTADYNKHFKGIYLTFAALVAANPTGEAGDYAQVNVVGAADVLNYNWDAEESVWIPNAVGGSGATNTDELPEGTTNLYFTVTRFLANLTYANVISALGFTPSTAPNNAQKNSDITKAEIEAKLIGEITTHTHPASGGTGDMVLADAQTVTGEKTFLNLKLGLRNAANTFTSFFTNANTAARTYTLPNKNITIAGTDDVALKQNLIAGTVNRILKNVGTNLFGDSRLWDTGTFLGIGTVNTPTKDITFGNQANREIGIEESLNTIKGRDLINRAGRTVNYVLNSIFNKLYLQSLDYRHVAPLNNGNLLVCALSNIYLYNFESNTLSFHSTSPYPMLAVNPTDNNIIYTSDTNSFTAYKIRISINNGITFSDIAGEIARAYFNIVVAQNGDVYATLRSSGDIYKRTGGVGNFVAMGFPSRTYQGLILLPSGDLYVSTSNDDVYKINAVAGTLTALGVGNANRTYGYYMGGDAYYQLGGGSSAIVKQIGLSGNFVASGLSNPSLFSFAVLPNNNVCYGANNDIYMQQNNGAGTADLDGGTYKAIAGTGKGTGKSRYEIWTGQKIASGTDMQIEILRTYVDENGYLVHLSTPIYADNAAALAGGLVVGTHYRTATGISMIVY